MFHIFSLKMLIYWFIVLFEWSLPAMERTQLSYPVWRLVHLKATKTHTTASDQQWVKERHHHGKIYSFLWPLLSTSPTNLSFSHKWEAARRAGSCLEKTSYSLLKSWFCNDVVHKHMGAIENKGWNKKHSGLQGNSDQLLQKWNSIVRNFLLFSCCFIVFNFLKIFRIRLFYFLNMVQSLNTSNNSGSIGSLPYSVSQHQQIPTLWN